MYAIPKRPDPPPPPRSKKEIQQDIEREEKRLRNIAIARERAWKKKHAKKTIPVVVKARKEAFSGPSFRSRKGLCTWVREVEDTPLMLEVGNIQRSYHGTKDFNITSITKASLKPGSSACMFGSGIYSAPNVEKASHYCNGSRYYILECRVALGVPLYPERTAAHTLSELRQTGYNSVVAGGRIEGAWGGTINTEFVVYDPEQIVVVKVHEYEGEARTSYAWFSNDSQKLRDLRAELPQKKVDPELSTPALTWKNYHPCIRNGKICSAAMPDGKCIIGNKNACLCNQFKPTKI